MLCFGLTGCNTEAVKLDQTADVEENETRNLKIIENLDIELRKTANHLTEEKYQNLHSSVATELPQEGDPKVFSAYQKLMNEKKYRQYTDNWTAPANTYAIIDINQDNIPELLINGLEEHDDWGWALLYTYDLSTDEVKLLENIYYYDQIRYSPKYKAIEYTELRPSRSIGSSDFYTVKDNQFVHSFSVVWEYSDSSDSREFHLSFPDENDENKSITEEESYAYNEELLQIDFKPIPYTETRSSKPDLMQYMNTNIYDFVDIMGDMYNDDDAYNCIAYVSDEEIYACANLDTKLINYFAISYDCDYSIAGIEYGMPFLDAYELLKHKGLELLIDEPDFKQFQYKNGDQISIHAYDQESVNTIFVYTADRWEDVD